MKDPSWQTLRAVGDKNAEICDLFSQKSAIFKIEVCGFFKLCRKIAFKRYLTFGVALII